eukprot:scaffold250627_cov46-Attheya_sp.AAC.2
MDLVNADKAASDQPCDDISSSSSVAVSSLPIRHDESEPAVSTAMTDGTPLDPAQTGARPSRSRFENAPIRIPSLRNSSEFLVSENEEDTFSDGIRNAESRSPSMSFDSEMPRAANPQNQAEAHAPIEIPPEPADDEDNTAPRRSDSGLNDADSEDNRNDEEEEEDESDYEYDYEDEDECHISGFLISDHHHMPLDSVDSTDYASSSGAAKVSTEDPNCIKDDESVAEQSESEHRSSSTAVTRKRSTWKEPSQAAVNMSLRAEREKTGGKRRLASDLYKIMMADTEEAGFNLEPQSEDSMDKWRIKLFKFDEDSNLHKDLVVLGVDHVELEMGFPDQYPFEPPFVRVVQPRFKRQTGFVMNGALCMELLTSEGWNPVNDIESVIVSIRSLLVVGDGRLSAAVEMSKEAREAALAAAKERSLDRKSEEDSDAEGEPNRKRHRQDDSGDERGDASSASKKSNVKVTKTAAGHYSASEARAAYSHLSEYHKKKGWDSSGWWARKG